MKITCLEQSSTILLRFDSVGRIKYTAGASEIASRSEFI